MLNDLFFLELSYSHCTLAKGLSNNLYHLEQAIRLNDKIHTLSYSFPILKYHSTHSSITWTKYTNFTLVKHKIKFIVVVHISAYMPQKVRQSRVMFLIHEGPGEAEDRLKDDKC